MLDFGALEKPQAPVDLVRDAGIEQRALHHAALRVAAVQQRDVAARRALAVQLLRLLDEPLRLGVVAGGFAHPHRLARPGLGAQVLAQPVGVARDELVGRVQDVAVGAVVALQLDDALDVELALERRHVAHLGAAERINALVVVADGEHRGVRGTEHLQPRVLQLVGVLKLVHQDVGEAMLVVLAQGGVVAHELEGAQHQLGEVHHPFALALVLVRLEHQLLDPRRLVAHLHVLGAQPVVLVRRDGPAQLLGHVALLVQAQGLDHALDRRQLVGGVQDLKALRQPRQLPVRAQEAVAQSVEGADPHAAHRQRQQRAQTGQHLLGRLVGERHRHHAGRRQLAGLDQPRDARGQHARLAGAGPGQDQRRARGQRDRGALFGVQVLQQGSTDGVGRGGHRAIVIDLGRRGSVRHR